MKKFEKNKEKIILDIQSCVTNRFASFIDSEVLVVAEVLDPTNLPIHRDMLTNYGNKEIATIPKHFQSILSSQGFCTNDDALVQREWLQLKLDMFHRYKDYTLNDFCKVLLTQKANMYPNVCHLASIVQVLPVATAQVERQFSCVKRMLGD